MKLSRMIELKKEVYFPALQRGSSGHGSEYCVGKPRSGERLNGVV
jgi:hypothetical protein